MKESKKLGINTVAVLSGFQNEEVLSTYNPDYILKNITEPQYVTPGMK